jgi:hypothetical protein
MKIVRDFRRTGISKPRKIRENQGAMSGVLNLLPLWSCRAKRLLFSAALLLKIESGNI